MTNYKKITTLLITVLLLLSATTMVGAKSAAKVGVVTVSEDSYLNIRKEANEKSEIVGSLNAGDEIKVVSSEDGWCKFSYKKKAAYVSAEYIDFDGENDGTSSGREVVSVAKKYLGTPYVSGGSSPSKGFDCSGFTSHVYKEIGTAIPRTASAQSKVGTSVKKSDLEYGDLVFFSTNGRSATHVGIYAGNNKIIHSPNSGKTVSYSSLSTSYYLKNYFGAKRIVK